MTLVQLAARIRSARTEIVLTAAEDAQGFAEALAELDKIAAELVSPAAPHDVASYRSLLHDCLDRLLAEFIAADDTHRPSTSTVLDLIVWSGSRLPPYKPQRVIAPKPRGQA